MKLWIITIILASIVLLICIALITIRILLIPGGNFHGTCSTQNQAKGNCPVCGADSPENCGANKGKAMKPLSKL